ncbi:MAG TPA: HTTM domain-containing protein [Polyangiaceae bacterium]|nr:HTTM domain-containing protein [Polyangiaceae bacterium]
MTLLSAIDRFFYPPAPAARLGAVRVAAGAFALIYLLARAGPFLSVASYAPRLFDPVGPVALLEAPLPAPLAHALFALTVVLAVPFALGFKYRVVGPLFALLLLWETSYRSSWGMKFHTENLLALHVLLLGFAPAADALSLDAQRRTPASASGAPAGAAPAEPHGRYGWALRALCLVTIVTYVLAGLAKIRNSGWDWADGEILRTHIAYDNVRKLELGSWHSPLGAALVPHAWLFPPLAWTSLLLELGAPLALLGRTAARIWALGVWAFHVGVLLLMAIAFPYPLSFVAFVPFFPVERWLERPRVRAVVQRAQALLPRWK